MLPRTWHVQNHCPSQSHVITIKGFFQNSAKRTILFSQYLMVEILFSQRLKWSEHGVYISFSLDLTLYVSRLNIVSWYLEFHARQVSNFLISLACLSSYIVCKTIKMKTMNKNKQSFYVRKKKKIHLHFYKWMAQCKSEPNSKNKISGNLVYSKCVTHKCWRRYLK